MSDIDSIITMVHFPPHDLRVVVNRARQLISIKFLDDTNSRNLLEWTDDTLVLFT